MSGDKIQRQMDFILNQQAKFNEDMIKLEEKTRQNTEDITRLVGAVMNLTIHVQENSLQIAALIENGKETDRRFAELREEYDSRINSLIEVVERYFTNGQK